MRQILAIEEHEANFYRIQDEVQWYVRLQFNGEMHTEQQKELAKKIADLIYKETYNTK